MLDLSPVLTALLEAHRLRPLSQRLLSLALRRRLLPLPRVSAERLARRRARQPIPPEAVAPFVWRAPAERAIVSGGALSGARCVIKESMAVQGAPRWDGTRDPGPQAAADAVIVARIRAAGADIVGTAQMTELGVDGLGIQPYQGTLDNPAAPGFLTGGSSSGSAAAVAGGLVDLAVGSDALGSVRIPAGFCGLVGLKPTYGSLPLTGYHTVAPSLDMPGPITRTAADCARLWQVMAGLPPGPVAAAAPVRLGVVRELAALPVATAVAQGRDAAVAALGGETVEVSIPWATECTLLAALAGALEVAESGVRPRAPTPIVRFVTALGEALRAVDAALVQARRAALREATLAALQRCDLLVMPTTAVPAPARTRALLSGATDIGLLMAVGGFTPLANCTGLPAIAVPTARDGAGRPVSTMFVGRPGSETQLLAAAAAVEARLPAHPTEG